MIWTKKNKKKVGYEESLPEDMELTDEEFFLAEEIDGYNCCEGLNAERCNSDCFKTAMVPTITILS